MTIYYGSIKEWYFNAQPLARGIRELILLDQEKEKIITNKYFKDLYKPHYNETIMDTFLAKYFIILCLELRKNKELVSCGKKVTILNDPNNDMVLWYNNEIIVDFATYPNYIAGRIEKLECKTVIQTLNDEDLIYFLNQDKLNLRLGEFNKSKINFRFILAKGKSFVENFTFDDADQYKECPVAKSRQKIHIKRMEILSQLRHGYIEIIDYKRNPFRVYDQLKEKTNLAKSSSPTRSPISKKSKLTEPSTSKEAVEYGEKSSRDSRRFVS